MCNLSAALALRWRYATCDTPVPDLVVGADLRLRFYGPPDPLVDLPLLVLGHSMHPKCFGIFLVLGPSGRLRSLTHTHTRGIVMMVNGKKQQQQQSIECADPATQHQIVAAMVRGGVTDRHAAPLCCRKLKASKGTKSVCQWWKDLVCTNQSVWKKIGQDCWNASIGQRQVGRVSHTTRNTK